MSPAKAFAMFVLCLTSLEAAHGKVYSRCELARELVQVHEIPQEQVATWVCIAKHESDFNTSAVNHGSGDYGLLQISNLFWCSPDGYAACGITCSALVDDNIEDDVVCARRIYRQHQRMSGDGFNAWSVYGYYCKNRNLENYVKGCFDDVGKHNVEVVPSSFTTQGPNYYYYSSVGPSVGPFLVSNFLSTTERLIPKWKTSPKSIVKVDNSLPKFVIYKAGKSDYTFRRKGNGFQLFKVLNEESHF